MCVLGWGWGGGGYMQKWYDSGCTIVAQSAPETTFDILLSAMTVPP